MPESIFWGSSFIFAACVKYCQCHALRDIAPTVLLKHLSMDVHGRMRGCARTRTGYVAAMSEQCHYLYVIRLQRLSDTVTPHGARANSHSIQYSHRIQ